MIDKFDSKEKTTTNKQKKIGSFIQYWNLLFIIVQVIWVKVAIYSDPQASNYICCSVRECSGNDSSGLLLTDADALNDRTFLAYIQAFIHTHTHYIWLHRHTWWQMKSLANVSKGAEKKISSLMFCNLFGSLYKF